MSLVNIMAMDYGAGAAPNPEGAMGRYAVMSAKASRPSSGRCSACRPRRHLAVTPMIGINDVASEVFTLVDARKLRRSAGRVHLGGLSMWQLGRDAKCEQPSATTQIDCSGVAQQPWGFQPRARLTSPGAFCYHDVPEQPPLATLLVQERTTAGPSPLVMRKTLVDLETDVMT